MVTSLTGLIALPFFPWILLAIVAIGIGPFIYEIVRTKSVGGAIDALEADLKSVTGETAPAEALLAAAVAKV